MKKITVNNVLYWLPRIIVAAYPIVVFGSTIVDTFRLGFSLIPFIGFMLLTVILGYLAWISWMKPKFGGILFTAVSLLIFVSASNTSIGVDWMAIGNGAVPMLIAGLLFLREGFVKKTTKIKENK